MLSGPRMTPWGAGSGSQKCSSDVDQGRTLYWPALKVLVQSKVPGWLLLRIPPEALVMAGTSDQMPKVMGMGGTVVAPLRPNQDVHRWMSVIGPVFLHLKSFARIIDWVAAGPGGPWPTKTSKPLIVGSGPWTHLVRFVLLSGQSACAVVAAKTSSNTASACDDTRPWKNFTDDD